MKSTFQMMVSVSFLFVLTTAAFSEDMLYWSNWRDRTICRANQDGTGLEVIYDDFDGRGIAIDPSEGYIYWTDRYYNDLSQKVHQIKRARLNGSEQTTLVAMQSTSTVWEDIAIDLQNNKLYWADYADYIYRSNLDGSDVEVFLSGLTTPHDIELDPTNNHIYWTDWQDRELWRADLDGTNKTLLVSYSGNNEYVYHIALDIQNGHIYLSRNTSGGSAIERVNLNGTNGIIIFTYFNAALRDILINPVDNRLYFTYLTFSEDYIASCKLDGTDFRYDVSGLTGQPWGLKLGPGFACQTPPTADLDGDCKVDLADFAIVASGWMDVYFDLTDLADQWLDCGLTPDYECQ